MDWMEGLKKAAEGRWGGCAFTSGAILVSALLQCYVIQVFLLPAGIISGGFTGLAMVASEAGRLAGIPVSMEAAMVALNIPVALVCCRCLSLRFTVFSLAQVALSSLFLKVFHFEPLFHDQVLDVIFGGVFLGFSVAAALKGNASTGGTDFIALYVSNRTGRSIWSWVFAGNAVLYCVCGLLYGWMAAGYSIVLQYIATRVIFAFHRRYDQVTLQITTKKGPEVVKAYISGFPHGISCTETKGGYSRQRMYLLNTVLSAYESAAAIRLIRRTDGEAVINVWKTEQFVGKFYRKPMG